MKEELPRMPRRTFMAAAVCVPALAVAALLARRAAAPLPAAPQTLPPAGVGYHETEHIRSYYRTAAY